MTPDELSPGKRPRDLSKTLAAAALIAAQAFWSGANTRQNQLVMICFGLMFCLLLACSIAVAAPIDRGSVSVVDGDTIRVEGEPQAIRLVGFNTPETRGAQCPAERSGGPAASSDRGWRSPRSGFRQVRLPSRDGGDAALQPWAPLRRTALERARRRRDPHRGAPRRPVRLCRDPVPRDAAAVV